MDVPFLIRQRLETLGLEQRDLARAARVTESYVSQILTRKKAPPAPHRTDIYDRMDRFLKLPAGELARVADSQRKEELKRELGDGPASLHPEVRELLLRKCSPEKTEQIRVLFERQPFGELERLVTQKLLDVAKHDTDVYHLSARHAALLDPLIQSWDVDLATFALEVVLNPRVVAEPVRRFEFVEATEPARAEPGLEEFLRDRSLSGGATAEELAFLKRLRFRLKGRRPTPLYYYRELQSLRDPLHFRAGD
ncbi:MAG TPA: helix-turn-helix transcriptional regulator [Gemmatimonadales bacterium]